MAVPVLPVRSALLCLLSIASVALGSCCNPPDHASRYRILTKYVGLWSGHFDLLNSTFLPNVSLHMDHILLADGNPVPPVRNSGDFLATIKGSRSGWDKYEFEIVRWVGEDSNVAVRWKMHGIIGQNFGRPTDLKPGDSFSYHGTDFLQLDPCSGLIKHVDIAQDSLWFYHNLGVKSVNV